MTCGENAAGLEGLICAFSLLRDFYAFLGFSDLWRFVRLVQPKFFLIVCPRVCCAAAADEWAARSPVLLFARRFYHSLVCV